MESPVDPRVPQQPSVPSPTIPIRDQEASKESPTVVPLPPAVETKEADDEELFDPARELSDDSLCKLLDIEWRDHFQTRTQTWKALQCQLVIVVAIIGFDWKVDELASAIAAGLLLVPVAAFGMLITKRHREVECDRFANISAIEKRLGMRKSYPKPKKLKFRMLFDISERTTAAFIFRLQFLIGVFAIVYVVLRAWYGR